MNKKLLLILPLLALSLGGCNSSEDIDDEDVISYPPGVVPSDPAQPTGNGGNGDHTTQDEDIGAEVTGIDSVISSPEKFDVVEGIEIADITLKLSLSNGGSINRHPTSINYDASGASKGDAVSITAYYDSFSTTFNSEVDVWHDEISPSTPGNPKPTGNTYSHWTYNSTCSNATYDILSNGSSYIQLGKDPVSAGMPGIVTPYSGGRVKKIIVDWDESMTNSAELLVFGSSIPFDTNEDVRSLTKTASIVALPKTSSTYEYTISDSNNYYYLGFKGNGAAAKIAKLIIVWDTEADIPTLDSMEYAVGSKVSSETGQTSWDYSNVSVIGTYSDGASGDITKFINFSSTTTIPAEPTAEMDVSVTATYKRGGIDPYTSTLKGKVTQGYETVSSFAYNDIVTGGTIGKTGLTNDSSYNGYKENGTVDTECSIRVLKSTPHWTTSPSKIIIEAKIGYGKDSQTVFENQYAIYVVLLGSGGTELGDRVLLTDKLSTKAGENFSVEVPQTDNVYGFKVIHKRKKDYVLRFYSGSLRYLP